MATVTYEIDRRDFEKWLESQGERKFESGSFCHCPVAEYLSEALGVKVRCTANLFSFYKKTFPLPEWAKQFIHMVDMRAWETHDASTLMPLLRRIPEDEA